MSCRLLSAVLIASTLFELWSWSFRLVFDIILFDNGDGDDATAADDGGGTVSRAAVGDLPEGRPEGLRPTPGLGDGDDEGAMVVGLFCGRKRYKNKDLRTTRVKSVVLRVMFQLDPALEFRSSGDEI